MHRSGTLLDTTPEAAWVQMQVYRRMPGERRLLQALEMSDVLRAICADGVRQQHPEYDEERIRLAVIRRLLSTEQFHKAFPAGKLGQPPMTHANLLLRLAQHLEAAGIPFMIAGSVGSSFYSQPRATNDVDLVIDPTAAQLDIWLTLLGEQFYASREAALDALRRRSMFNIIDLTSGVKADLILRKDRPFSREEFSRRQFQLLQGQMLPLATPEDIILSKLEWNKITPSERQLRDALNVAQAQWLTLDQAYLRKWAPQLGVSDELDEMLRLAAEGQNPPENTTGLHG